MDQPDAVARWQGNREYADGKDTGSDLHGVTTSKGEITTLVGVCQGSRLVLPARTASTTSRIESRTSCGWSLWISCPLSVLMMCLEPGTAAASSACACFWARSVT